MSITHRKIKSVAKDMLSRGSTLETKILQTMKRISDIVGSTLGPGGSPVLIERQEFGVPNLITKDGVTVFRSLGFADATAHAICEIARESSVRTATEAGDGTTTATVLSEAIVRNIHKYCKDNPKVSNQKVVRIIQNLHKTVIEPTIRKLAITPDEALLEAVATCSANGDKELAAAVMRCFEIAGDDGNVTIFEKAGPSGYDVEALKGYPVGIGYEDCCRRFSANFINDKPNNRVYLEKPVFVLNYGPIREIQSLLNILSAMGGRWNLDQQAPHNFVIVATEFSESVLGHLEVNWNHPETINVYPLTIPRSPINNGDMQLLEDLQAITGSPIYDSLNRPIEQARVEELGPCLEYFEASRFRSNIVGIADEGLQMARVEELQQQLKNPEGELEKRILEERLAKLTGGIAKLTVVGPSISEIRERKDRCDDAACAVRGARKHGCLPGGGWTLLQLVDKLTKTSGDGDIIKNVLIPSLLAPIQRLMVNCGLNDEEVKDRINEYDNLTKELVWDGVTDTFVDPTSAGIVDSVPAVLEAIRNAISGATLWGTLGAIVVFQRDTELERQEAADTYEYERNVRAPQAGTGSGGYSATDL